MARRADVGPAQIYRRRKEYRAVADGFALMQAISAFHRLGAAKLTGSTVCNARDARFTVAQAARMGHRGSTTGEIRGMSAQIERTQSLDNGCDDAKTVYGKSGGT